MSTMEKIIDKKVAEKTEISFEDVQKWLMKDINHYTKLFDFLSSNNEYFDNYIKNNIIELVYNYEIEESIAETYMSNMGISEKAKKIKEWINELI